MEIKNSSKSDEVLTRKVATGILKALHEAQLTNSSIAKLISSNAPCVYKNIKLLISEELVEYAKFDDKRSKPVKLTKKGNALAKLLFKIEEVLESG